MSEKNKDAIFLISDSAYETIKKIKKKYKNKKSSLLKRMYGKTKGKQK